MEQFKVQKKKKFEILGQHLTIDAYGISKEFLIDHKKFYDLLINLPETLGMHILIPPYVVSCEEGDMAGDWGVSGMVMIKESHISAHGWPALGYLSMDIYSCRPFDNTKTISFLKKYWNWKRAKIQRLIRK